MRLRALLVILFSLFLTLSFGFVLKDVQFDGLKTVPKTELEPFYKQYLGKDINNYAIEDIISELDGTGYFDEITYELKDSEANEKILFIKVTENAPVSKINIEISGHGIISKETIQASVTLKEGKAFSFPKFWESIDNIAKMYSDNGYTVATPRTQDKSFAFVYVSGNLGEDNVVNFKVTEYALYNLEFEILSDNKAFNDEFEKIKPSLSLPKYIDYENKNWFLKIFDSGKNYVPTLSTLQGFFQNLSKYVFFKVIDLSVIEEDKDIPAKTLVLTVAENTIVSQPVALKGIRVKGNTLISESELVGEVKEATYTNLDILKKIQQVKVKYEKAGYFINLNLEAGEDGYLYILVNETKVKEVKIKGNTNTKEYVFNDLIYVKPGDYLNRTDLQNTYIELKKLNFFKEVNINFEQTEATSTDVNIVLTVEEKDKKFDFQGGVTWGPVKDKPWYEGFAGLLSLSSTNPFGYGESFSISLQKALSNTNLSFSFGIRKPFELPLIINTSLSYNQTTENATETTKYSASLSLSTLKTQFGQFSFSTAYTDTTVSSDTTVNSKTLSFTGSYIYETLDNLFVPMTGYSLTLSGTKYVPVSENGSDALSYFVDATYHLPFTPSISFATRIYNAQVFQTSGEPVNFSLAGPYQVRGVKVDQKGTVLVLNNNEIRFKEPDQMIYFSLFFDVGILENTYNFDNIKSSAGFELGLVIPMFGLVRVGWGLPITPTFVPNPNFYFIIGQTF
ncbi:BamA/OMP85 family outer membrane protein [Fervidobacterium gondwanense]|uniref:BamA/OMP85 family outer membrane protein n=1 Tax=Fervidobacterium gondwanense TaxID=44754 RepID=UPI003C76BD48